MKFVLLGLASLLACSSAMFVQHVEFVPELARLEVRSLNLARNLTTPEVPEPRSANLRQNNNCNCGRSSMNGGSRIVGGDEARQGEFPWGTYLQVYYRSKRDGRDYVGQCGATIIDPEHVLSAAHCFLGDDKELRGARVYIGNIDKSKGQPINGVELSTGNYNSRTMKNDIAILKLQKAIQYNKDIQPACIPFKYQGQPNMEGNVWASGWGTTREGGSTTERQRKVQLRMISNNQCNDYGMDVDDTQVCTYTRNKDTCQGDSGGSIDYLGDRGTYYTMGITSYGYGCAREDSPGVYTRVAEFAQAIKQSTGYDYCEQ